MTKRTTGFITQAERHGDIQAVAFEDLTDQEQEGYLSDKTPQFKDMMIKTLALKFRELSIHLQNLKMIEQ